MRGWSQPRLLGGRYEVDGPFARSDMVEVFRVRDIQLDRILAVKALRADLATDQEFQARFRREAQSAVSLNHPNIVAVYDTGEDMGTGVLVPYIVMEFVDGRTVRDLLQDGRRLLPERSLELIDGVLRALDHSHQAGVVHQGIKPQNVLVRREGEVKVMDFGIARTMSGARAVVTQTAQVIGTAKYLSPEQVRDERVDSRSDLYSTGCLLYESLIGRPPFTGDSAVAIAGQHVRENPVPPSRVDADLPPWGDIIVLRAMAKSPADRYQTAAEMRADLQRAASGTLISSSRSRAKPRETPNDPARRTSSQLTNLSRTTVRQNPVKTQEPEPIILRRPVVIRISEAPSRREESLGDETITFDNAKSSSTAVETIRLTRTARVSTVVELTKARSISGGAGVAFFDLAKVQASLQDELSHRYSSDTGSELTLEQSTVVNIPAYTKVQVVLHWKLIWLTGMITLAERGTELAELPFGITVGLAFDKETRDV